MSSSKESVCRIGPTGDMVPVRRLFREYAAEAGLDLSFQGFAEELAGLPGRYASPGGSILLAEVDGEAVGCVALRPLGGLGLCEKNRLFVRPGFTGHGLGRRLAQAAVATARERGYTAMRLDTLSSMRAANVLYRRLGFRPIAPYCFNPLPGALFYELDLTATMGLDTRHD